MFIYSREMICKNLSIVTIGFILVLFQRDFLFSQIYHSAPEFSVKQFPNIREWFFPTWPFLNSVEEHCVRYIFVSLFCMSKREHLWNKKCFLFHFESSFRSWVNQILTFQVFVCHDIIKCLSMKYKTHFTE